MGCCLAWAQEAIYAAEKNFGLTKAKIRFLKSQKNTHWWPLMPHDVWRAKHIRYKIYETADLGEGEAEATEDVFKEDDD